MSDYDAEFFWDPVCPWAWITSRWVHEAMTVRDYRVDWRFICLKLVNKDKDYGKDFPDGYVKGHTAGLRMLRVAAAAKAEGDNAAAERFYTELGTRIHNEERRREFVDEELEAVGNGVITDALSAAGLAPNLLAAADDAQWDEVLQADTDVALERTGGDVGTPILTFGPGTDEEASFFGPVISRIPRGDEAAELWDAVVKLARWPGMAELKRSVRERPQFD